METVKLNAGYVLCKEGDPMSQIHIITRGRVEAMLGGKAFIYEQGDVLGVCDLSLGVYSCTYTAVTDVEIVSYSYKNLSALETLFTEKAGVAYLVVCSMGRQIVNLLQYKISLKNESDRAYDYAKKLYPQYEDLCAQYAFTAKKLAGVCEVTQFSEMDIIDEWIYTYYIEIKNLNQSVHKEFFGNKPGIDLGFIRKAAEDSYNAIQVCRDYMKYLECISQVFFNDEEHDLFAVISDLHFGSIGIKGADEAVGKLMMQLTKLLGGMTGVDSNLYPARINAYMEKLKTVRASVKKSEAPASAGINRNLEDSMSVILEYSGCPEETCNRFSRCVTEFAETSDKDGVDETIYGLRKQLTAMFYDIYKNVLVKSLSDPAPPTIIKMFLNLGYVDAALAEPENADYLYSIADSLKGDPGKGIYTISEWLAAIYRGEKEPCKSELGEDYADYIRNLKTSQKLDEREVNRLMADSDGKLRFELEKVFPVTNRITCGKVSTFCPLFSSHNVMRNLDASLLTTDLITETLDDIRNIDFSAFYRPVMFEYPQLGSASGASKETFNVEVLPDVILMPNVGVRGIMWQEIEGRKRNTPSRMFVPLFLQGDRKALFIRLTSEFRWEMCKRIQGVRWNDVTDPSLTGEICDFLQFFKTNRELSSEAKEDIKNMLMRSRNNYKTVFSSYYADWITYEANSIFRLHKNVRKMMFTYCPFPTPIREKLTGSPQFTNLFSRYENKKKLRDKQLSYIMQKFEQLGKNIPQEIYDEREYIAR